MTINRRQRQRGSAMVEFTLVGIALLFVLISIFEMARGMWVYHTLAHVSKEATRYLIVHGTECQTRGTCQAEATLGGLESHLRYHGVGLVPEGLQIQVHRNGTQVIGSGGSFVTVSSMTGSTTVWDANANSGMPIQVAVRYPFRSALAMLWPGAQRVSFTLVTLGANSWDTIQF